MIKLSAKIQSLALFFVGLGAILLTDPNQGLEMMFTMDTRRFSALSFLLFVMGTYYLKFLSKKQETFSSKQLVGWSSLGIVLAHSLDFLVFMIPEAFRNRSNDWELALFIELTFTVISLFWFFVAFGLSTILARFALKKSASVPS